MYNCTTKQSYLHHAWVSPVTRNNAGMPMMQVGPDLWTEDQKIFSLPRVVPCFPLLGLTPSVLFMGLSSTLIYTSELILCSTNIVPSATRPNIHMYPYFLFAAIHHLKSSPTLGVFT